MRSLRCGIAALLFLSVARAEDYDPKVELGRRLFMDPTVSRAGKFSCASCHDPERSFSDARKASEDENGVTRRHSQPLLDLQPTQPLHWDGEFGSLAELLTARLGPPEESLQVARTVRTRHVEAARAAGRAPDEGEFKKAMASLTPPYYGPVTTPGGRPAPTPLLLRLEEDDRYAAAFVAAYGSSAMTTERLVDAMSAYLLSIRSGESAFDRYHRGDPEALSPAQRRGLALFTGKASCASCHTIDDRAARPTFTDNAFHNTGVTFRQAAIEFGGQVKMDGGAGEMNFVKEDLGRFKTPPLRDVARRAPYMHDGSLETLEEVVRYYDRGGTPNRHLDAEIRALRLSDGEVKDLVAFLESLTGDGRPGLGPLPDGARRGHLRILDLRGQPLRGLPVEVFAAGDRLLGGRMNEMPQVHRTDDAGWLVFDFPAWTHVRLVNATHEIHYDWLIPDCVDRMTVMAAPRDKVALKLRMQGSSDSMPAKIVAVKPGTSEPIATFRRTRRAGRDGAIYVAERRVVLGPFIATLEGIEGVRELDLSGGWAEPLDLRQG